MKLPTRLQAILTRYDKPLGAAFLVGMCVLWFVLHSREEGTYPKLHALGLHDWTVHCEGHGRIYRLQSENTGDHRSGTSIMQRSLSLFNDAGEELYFTVRFDPDGYETDNVWSFKAGWDNRLFAPRWRSGEVLYGDEERFEISAAFDTLTVLTKAGKRLTFACH